MIHVLVVDDDPEDRELVRRCLQEDDDPMEVTFAEDGSRALEALSERVPDIVLTDLRMPSMDGLELVEQIHDEYPLVPVILMTAKGNEQIAVQALRAGASSYVPKSDFREDLCDTLRQVVELAEAKKTRHQVLRYLEARETRFVAANDIKLIGPLVAYFQESLERLGFGDEGVRGQIGMALMEALANAMVRGNLEVGSELRRTDRDAYDALIAQRQQDDHYTSRTVTITARESVVRVQYQIRDEGPGFDPHAVPDPTAASNLLAVSGRGIMLMRTFMDEVVFNDVGNCVTMTKSAPKK